MNCIRIILALRTFETNFKSILKYFIKARVVVRNAGRTAPGKQQTLTLRTTTVVTGSAPLKIAMSYQFHHGVLFEEFTEDWRSMDLFIMNHWRFFCPYGSYISLLTLSF